MFYLLQRDCHRNPTELGTSSEAALELRNGDDDPNAARRARWSGKQPVSNLGAWRNAHGQQEIDKAFTNLGVRFPDRTSYQFDLQTTDVAGHMTYPGRAGARPSLGCWRVAHLHVARYPGQTRRADGQRWPIALPTRRPTDTAT
ncbi:MAG: DUF4440 domain-containing protein [Dermatophilaceae bacterium]